MRFDDRLATVLAQPAADAHDRAVRWRQLVDLVARSGGEGDRDLLDRALDLIRRDARSIREPLRAATARAIAGQPVPLALLALFAADKLAVAAPLIAPAMLDGDALDTIRAAASPDVRRFLDNLHPPPEPEPVLQPTDPDSAEDGQVPSIGDVLSRIERLRAGRDEPSQPPAETHQPVEPEPAPLPPPKLEQPEPPEPLVDAPVAAIGQVSAFRWECSPGGDIEWVEGAPRGALVGRSIATADPDEGVDDCVERAFAIRAPFRDCVLELGETGAVGGSWTISGAPAFAPGDGRFIGYRGIARRGAAETQMPAAAAPALEGHDALRELIHEIRTPLNAIIGFAEIIDGQYFGPAHRRYRERAAEIVSNARSLLTAAEDLDFVARFQSRARSAAQPTDLSAIVPEFADALRGRAARLGVSLDFDGAGRDSVIALDPELVERLLRRFSDAILSAAAPGEALSARMLVDERMSALAMSRPRAIIMAGREDLLDPEFTIGGADRALLGLGFSLRLVNGLIELAGGRLEIDDNWLVLQFPRA